MSALRSMLFGAVALAGASFGFSMPAQADPDVGFYIGANGARIYSNDYDDDYYYRPHRSYYRYRTCFNQTWYSWRFGERVRVVDRVCYNRWGRRRVVDRDYYPIYGYRYDDY